MKRAFAYALMTAAIVSTGAAALAEDVGRVAAIVELVELERGGGWQRMQLGDGVAVGDKVRTDSKGRVRLVFSDGSVVVVSSRSEIVIDENVYEPADGAASSVLDVLKGKIRAVVSEYYQKTGAYEVRTQNSISGVRGTDFVVVYDPDRELTEVVGVSGSVVVRGTAAPDAAVEVTTRMLSTVEGRTAASEPVTLSEERFRYYLEGLEFVGQDAPGSVLFNQPTLIGDEVPEPERAVAGRPALEGELDVDRIPGEIDEISPDAAGVAGQPADAIDSGDLGIRF